MKKTLLLFSLMILGFLFLDHPVKAQNSREWTVVASYQIPGKASGLAWDGTYLYSGLYSAPGDDNLIYKIDPADGSYTLQCAGPFASAYGLTFDGTYLWTTDHPYAYDPAIAIQFDMSGGQVSSFNLPETYFSGIEWDNNRFWTCCYYDPDGMVYKLTSTGGIITQFASPNNQPWDICRENDNLWIVDYNANMIYKTDTLGNVVESHPSVGIKPAGITFDGQYLWYCDGELQAQSTLYKIDLGGSGTPVISVPEDSHDYGIVTIGDWSVWNMVVENTGTGDLEITGLLIPDAVPVFTNFAPPQTISPGNSIEIPLTYQPTEPIPLNTEITIVSSDPVTPETPVTLTGNAVLNGPNLLVSEESHDYGEVRIHAFTRWFLEVTNNGSETLTISAINLNSDNFILDEGTLLPLDVGVLQTEKIGVWFSPNDDFPYGVMMEIDHNGINQDPYPVYLSGTGLDIAYPIGSLLWYYYIDVSYDNSPKAVAAIDDITGDKVSDVIVCSEDDNIRCFNGNSHNLADVMWEKAIYAGTTYGQNALIIIDDIDLDEFQDVIVGTAWGDRSITAFSGKNGDQIWKHDTHEYGDGGWVYQVDARFDYNADGVKDILASTGDDANGTGPKRIYCLDALNGESIWECFTGGPNFAVISIEDMNGDDIPDALAGSSNDAETEGRVYGIDGSNGAIEWTYNAAGSSVWALEQLKDLNDDDIPDIAAGDFSGHIYYLDATNGNMLKNVSIGTSLILRFELADDVNADSHPDLLVANSGSNGVLLSGLDASTIWSHPLPDKPWNLAGSNDLSGDGIGDVLIGTLYSNNYCFFLDGVNGDELKSISFGTPVDAINSIPDFIGDGSYEMVAGGRDGTVHCYSGGTNSLALVPDQPSGLNTSFHSSAWPNPFREQVNISFYLPRENHVTIEIYTAGGKMIGKVLESNLPAGEHQVTWDGCNSTGDKCSEGIYIYRITAGEAHSTGTIVRM
ncbi:MAG: choice-of-anchor D domain-containing protein [Bacteroidales bacterium]|nr:choice-of-anchor D domain-containing protein [Bacteroidales bacterium]